MQRLEDHRVVGLLVALAGAVALAVALGSEQFLGLDPCALCLLERWPWRIVLLLGVAAAMLGRRAGRLVLWLALLVLLGSVALGVVHVGVEQHFWPSPLPECAAPKLHGHSLAQLLASMPARPSKPCDAPSFLIPDLPLSMASMNFLYSLAVSALLATYLPRLRGGSR